MVVCSYFLLNLTVAVMLDNFNELHKGDSALRKYLKELYGGKDVNIEAKMKEIKEKRNKNLKNLNSDSDVKIAKLTLSESC